VSALGQKRGSTASLRAIIGPRGSSAKYMFRAYGGYRDFYFDLGWNQKAIDQLSFGLFDAEIN
jgi:hypothetical protein